MEKVPLPEDGFGFKSPSPERTLIPGEHPMRRRSCSSCILFLILGAFVFALGCFAVYTAISVASSKNSSSDNLTAKPLTLEKSLEDLAFSNKIPENNKMSFEIRINGKKVGGSNDNKTEIVISDSSSHNVVDEFSTVKDFLNRIAGNDMPMFDKELSSKDKSKPKVISIESWEVRRIPKERTMPFNPFDMFNSPGDNFDDIINSFLPQMPAPTTPKPNRNIIMTPYIPSSTKPPKKDNSFPKTIFSDFEDVLSDIFYDEPTPRNEKNKTKPAQPKVFRKTYDPFLIPIGSSNVRPLTSIYVRPREEVEVFRKNVDKPYLDRYRSEKKSDESGEMDSLFNKFIGLDTIKPKYNQFQRSQAGKGSFATVELPHIDVFDNVWPSPPKWTKFPKKYESKTETTQDRNQNLTEFKTPLIATTFTTTPKPTYENSNATTVAP